MLFFPENSRFSRLWGKAMAISPATVSVVSPASLRIFPSSTESTLKSGTSSKAPVLTWVML